MLSKLKQENKGFTIIEVMIVLAIAGLIILIVLLAIPALQRNGRNTEAKNNASSVAAAITEFKSNNDGRAPNSISGTGNITVTSSVAGSIPATAKVGASTTIPAAPAAVSGTVPVSYAYNSKCNAAATAAVPGTARDVAVLYWVETAAAGAPKCIEA